MGEKIGEQLGRRPNGTSKECEPRIGIVKPRAASHRIAMCISYCRDYSE
jgi:hypothetical protein